MKLHIAMSSRRNYIFFLKIIRCKDAVIKMQILARSEVNAFHQFKTLEFFLSQVLVFKGWIFMGNLKAKIVRSPWKKFKLNLINKHKMFVRELGGMHEHLELKHKAISWKEFVPLIRFLREYKNSQKLFF